MKTFRIGVAAALAATLCMAGADEARALATYDEAVDGDLAFPADTTLALGVGANTVRGEVTFSNADAPESDDDAFLFIVPAGTSLTSVLFEAALLPVGSGDFFAVNPALRLWPSEVLLGDAFTLFPGAGPAFAAALPLGPGLYAIEIASFSGLLDRGDFRTAAYTFTLDVEPKRDGAEIPLPASAALLTAGLAGLAAARRRRRG